MKHIAKTKLDSNEVQLAKKQLDRSEPSTVFHHRLAQRRLKTDARLYPSTTADFTSVDASLVSLTFGPSLAAFDCL